VEKDRVRVVALEMATEIAENAPLAIQAMRESLNLELIEEFRAATERES
jgi:enoyl-CoA hydratase/carnithine racemase